MRVALGIVAAVVGTAGLVGQFASATNTRHTPEHETAALYRRLETHTARWDLLLIWTLPAAGFLMLIDHSWWPFVALVAAGVCASAGGREFVKMLSFRGAGVGLGGRGEVRLALSFLALWGVLAVIVGIYALVEVV